MNVSLQSVESLRLEVILILLSEIPVSTKRNGDYKYITSTFLP